LVASRNQSAFLKNSAGSEAAQGTIGRAGRRRRAWAPPRRRADSARELRNGEHPRCSWRSRAGKGVRSAAAAPNSGPVPPHCVRHPRLASTSSSTRKLEKQHPPLRARGALRQADLPGCAQLTETNMNIHDADAPTSRETPPMAPSIRSARRDRATIESGNPVGAHRRKSVLPQDAVALAQAGW